VINKFPNGLVDISDYDKGTDTRRGAMIATGQNGNITAYTGNQELVDKYLSMQAQQGLASLKDKK